MSESVRLTRDAAKLLIRIYRRYLVSLDDGCTDYSARYIGNSLDVIRLFALDDDPERVSSLLRELKRADFLFAIDCDDQPSDCELTCDGIAYMEGIWLNVARALGKGLTAAADVLLKSLSGI